MQKYSNALLNKNGDGIPSASVLVKDTDGNVVAIYSTAEYGELANPFTTDSLGNFSFYAANGRYNLTFSKDGSVIGTQSDVLLYDPADPGSTVPSALLASEDGSALVGYKKTGEDSETTTVQAQLRKHDVQLAGVINVKQFGAVGNGIADDTAAIQSAIDYLQSHLSNPPSLSTNIGVGRLHFPKGVYVVGNLVIGTQVGTRAFGMIISGDGELATSLLYQSNNGSLFSFKSYGPVLVENLAVIHTDHVNIQTNRLSWSNVCFDMNGVGGGRHFTTRNITTYGFDKVYSFVGTGNNDTNFTSESSFVNGNTVFYARNSEAVVNHIQNCSFGTEWNSIFDLGGFGHTTVQNCNIVISGTLFNLNNANDSIQNSRYVVDTCKFEYWAPYGATTGATTQLVNIADTSVDSVVLFKNCTLPDSNKTPASGIYTINVGDAPVKIQFDKCFIGTLATVRVDISGSNAYENRSYIRFTDCDSVPLPTNVLFTGTESGSTCRPPVSYVRCKGVNDITLCNYTNYSDVGKHCVIFTPRNGVTPSLVLGSGVKTFDYSLYGYPTLINSITVCEKSRVSTNSCSISVYSDSARTNLISTISIPNGSSSTPKAYTMSIAANTVVTEGLFFSTENSSSGGVEGMIALEYTNF